MKNLFILLSLLIGMSVNAQVAIKSDGTNPDNLSMLDVKSTSNGLLIQRMTIAQLNAIVSPATGLLIFCTENNQFFSNLGMPLSPYMSAMKSQWITFGSDIAYSGGNVGIGTSVPATLLLFLFISLSTWLFVCNLVNLPDYNRLLSADYKPIQYTPVRTILAFPIETNNSGIIGKFHQKPPQTKKPKKDISKLTLAVNILWVN